MFFLTALSKNFMRNVIDGFKNNTPLRIKKGCRQLLTQHVASFTEKDFITCEMLLQQHVASKIVHELSRCCLLKRNDVT